jgi:hypothetical protein
MAKASLAKILICIILVGLVIGISWGHICIWIRQYQRSRVIECNPEDVLPFVEKAFFVDFPENVEHLKIAKSKYKMMFINFLIRFSADPNAMDGFLKSFSEEVKFVKYSRDSRSERFLPKWFKEPIKLGKKKCKKCKRSKGRTARNSC